jgi:hypothetical protein
MIQSINSSTVNSTNNEANKSNGLEYQLTRYQKQLSECVNCESAKTSKGKSDIEEINEKISGIKNRIEEVAKKSIKQPSPVISSSVPPNITTGKIDLFV